MTDELPKLTDKENNCLMRYLTNGYKKSEAYRYAYDCSKMNDNSVNVESSRFFNNPKITLWLDKFQSNQQKTIQEELNYKATDHFKELQDMKVLALNCFDKQGNPNINAAIKTVELKGKLAGLYKETPDKVENVVTYMGAITLDGQRLDFQVGEDVQDNDTTSRDS